MVRFIGYIGEDGENMCEFAALSTDTLPTTNQGRALTEGSIASVYTSTSSEPEFKRFLDVAGTGTPDWLPFA